jgi:hypothetical protein
VAHAGLLSAAVTLEHEILLRVVAQFVSEARERAADLAGLADRDAAEAMASWSRADEVRQAAAAAAQANGYLRDEERASRRRRATGAGHATAGRPAGRAFDAPALHRLGVAGLLRSGHQFDIEALVSQVAGYLAGPAEQLWRYLVLNIEWRLSTTIEITGWRLRQSSQDDWNALRPIPAAADYAADPVWDPLLMFGEHLVLSGPDEQAAPVDGHRIWFFPTKETTYSQAWAPSLLLNLWRNDPVSTVAEYLVEPHRAVDRVYSSIPSQYVGPEGDYEIPLLGPLRIDDAQSPHLARFLDQLTASLQRWNLALEEGTQKVRKVLKKTQDRLRRSAVRFLETGEKVGFDCDVTFEADQPHVVLNYVSALENLLSAENEDAIDLRRRTAQRAAILLGRDDTQRTTIHDHVSAAYKVRNKIAHGDEPDAEELANAAKRLRPILRRALISAIVLGSRPELHSLCDNALLSHTALREQIEMPVETFRSAIRGG